MGYCWVPMCKHNTSRNPELSFFNFPSKGNPEMRKRWLTAIRRADCEPTNHSRICSWHFPRGKEGGPTRFAWTEEEGLIAHMKSMKPPTATGTELEFKRLIPNAIPTIFHPEGLPTPESNGLQNKAQEMIVKWEPLYRNIAVIKIEPDNLDINTMDPGAYANSSYRPESKRIKIEPSVTDHKDIKLLLKPVVLLEKIKLSLLHDIKTGRYFLPSKKLGKREDFVEKLKLDLQKLKHELRVDTVESDEMFVDVASGDVEQQRSVQPGRQIIDSDDEDDEDDDESEWIKVEDVSNSPNKKVYYIYSGQNEALDENPVAADCASKDGNSVDSRCLVITRNRNGVKKTRFKCSVCKKFYMTEHSLKVHFSRVHDLFPTECFKCGLILGSEKNLKIHMDIMHSKEEIGVKKYTCPLCAKNCIHRQGLSEHLECHKHPPFGCGGCRAPFVELKTLKLHLPCPQVAAGMPAFLCLLCEDLFFTATQLQRHFQVSHLKKTETPNEYNKNYMYCQLRGNGEKRFECKKCGKNFRFYDSVKKHLPCCVKACEFCGKVFEKELRLKRHVDLFHSDQAVECTICNKRFEKQWTFDAHQRKYRGECFGKVYMCNYCGQTLYTMDNLTRHLKRHEALSAAINASLNEKCP